MVKIGTLHISIISAILSTVLYHLQGKEFTPEVIFFLITAYICVYTSIIKETKLRIINE